MSWSLSKSLRAGQSSARKAKRQASARLRVEALEDRLAPAHFAVIADYGLPGVPEQTVANLVHSWNPDFIVSAGDNNYNGVTYDQSVGQYYHDFISPYTGSYGTGATSNKFWPTLGNEDYGATGATPYLSFFPPLPGNGRYYEERIGPVDFFVLNSNTQEPDGTSSSSIQAMWLKTSLHNSTAPWKIVVDHHPPYASGFFPSTTYMQWPFKYWGASIVLSGHEHEYERLSENGLPYIIDDSGGAGLGTFVGSPVPGSLVRYNADYGALLVDASSSQITFQFINTSGTVVDTFTMNYPLPGATSGLTATVDSPSEINLTWANVAGNTGFVVQRSTDGTNFTQIATVGTNITHYLDTGLTANTTYYYRVAAFNAGGNGPFSSTVTVNTQAMTADAPTGLTATKISSTQINLAWTDNSGGVDGFTIQRSTDGQTFTQIATVAPGVTTYADTNLTSTTVYYRVFGTNGTYSSSYSNIASTILPPAAPSNLVATAANFETVNLTWTQNSNNEDGFNVLQSLDGTNFTRIATLAANVTSYTVTDLLSSTTYYYRVDVFNSTGTSSSNVTSVTTPVPVPVAAPTNLVATPGSATRIFLTWTDNSSNPEEDSFKILKSTDGVNFVWTDSVNRDVTSYTASGLSPSTTYYYEVDAYSFQGGDSAPTNIASATTLTLPAAPSNLTATAASANQVNLAWTDNSTNPEEDGFQIWRSTDGVTFNWVATAAQNATTYADIGRSPSTTYYYQVDAYIAAAGASALTNTASATTMTLPAAPSNLTATVVTGGINLAWTSNSGGTETGFKINRSTDGVNFSWAYTVGTNVTAYSVTNLLGGTTYYFQVLAYSTAGNSAASNTVSATTLAAPAAPSNLTATAASASQINLAWTSNSGGTETGFKIYRSLDGVNYSWAATAGTNATAYSDTGLSASTVYYYQVDSYNANGNSAFSNAASAATMGLPAAPSNLTATSVNTGINLAWTSNSGGTETGFKIYRSTDGVNFTWAYTVGTSVTTYSVTGLSGSTTYYFQVRSYTSAGSSAASNTASATTLAAPASPSNLTATAASGTQINLAWTSNSGGTETGFKIYRSTDGVSFSWSATVGTGVTTYSDTGRSSSTTYYYQVRSYNAAATSAASNTASATTMTLPAAPSNLTATTVSSTQVNLSWTSNSGGTETGFKIYRSTDGVNFSWTGTVGTGVTTYSDTGRSSTTTYYYQVRAYNAAGNSAPSNTPPGVVGELAGPTAAGAVGTGETAGWSDTLGASATVGVYVDGSLTPDEQARVLDAINALNVTWMVTTGLQVVEVSDPSQANIIVENAVTSALGGQADGVLGDAEMSYASPTTLQMDNGSPYLQITGQVMANIIEGWNWYTGPAGGIASDQYDYQTVVTHELGHAVGLYHDATYYGINDDGYSVMDGNLDPGVTRHQLSPYDIAWLNHLYAYGANPVTNGVPETASAVDAGTQPTYDSPRFAPLATISPPITEPPVTLQTGSPALLGPSSSTRGITVSVPSLGTFSVSSEGTSARSPRSSIDPSILMALSQSPSPAVAFVASSGPSSTANSPVDASLPPSLVPPFRTQMNAYVESGGDSAQRSDNAQPEEMPSLADPGTSSPAPVSTSGDSDGVVDAHSGAALWRAACTACFADDGSAKALASQDIFAPGLAAEELQPALNPLAAIAEFAVILGGYWGAQRGNPGRPVLALKSEPHTKAR